MFMTPRNHPNGAMMPPGMTRPPNEEGMPMPNRRLILQPTIEVAVATTQENRFAIPAGGAKSGLVWVNIPKNGATATIDILGASSLTLLDVGSNSFWKLVGTMTPGASATGAFNVAITTVPDFLKWKCTGTFTQAIQFEIIVYLYDT